MKILLTSSGFDNDNLVGVFHELLGKKPESARALLIPTALISPESRKYVHVFMEDLYKVGIKEEHIEEYDLDKPYEKERIKEYDVVLVCPGDPAYLLQKVNEMHFRDNLDEFFINGGIYIGISAGSDIAALNLPDNLGYLDTTIECHAKEGHAVGPIESTKTNHIRLTDNQAIMIDGDRVSIIE